MALPKLYNSRSEPLWACRSSAAPPPFPAVRLPSSHVDRARAAQHQAMNAVKTSLTLGAAKEHDVGAAVLVADGTGHQADRDTEQDH
jgi:hypothetical protein